MRSGQFRNESGAVSKGWIMASGAVFCLGALFAFYAIDIGVRSDLEVELGDTIHSTSLATRQATVSSPLLTFDPASFATLREAYGNMDTPQLLQIYTSLAGSMIEDGSLGANSSDQNTMLAIKDRILVVGLLLEERGVTRPLTHTGRQDGFLLRVHVVE